VSNNCLVRVIASPERLTKGGPACRSPNSEIVTHKVRFRPLRRGEVAVGTEECCRCIIDSIRPGELKAAAADGAGTGIAVHTVPSKSAHTAKLERRSATAAETCAGAYGVMGFIIRHLDRYRSSLPVLDVE
jgi:hypothetical protein